MNLKFDIDPDVLKKLTLLSETPARNPAKEQIGLANFLQEAQDLAITVTTNKNRRHNGWMHAIQSKIMIRRKEYPPMFSTFASIMLLVSLLLGGSGITVAAAQNSLPDQPLYETKLWSEDLRLNLASDPQTLSQLSLDFATLRFEEIQKIFEGDRIPSEAVHLQFQSQIERAIQYASTLTDDQSINALQQIQTHLQTQQQTFLHVQANSSTTTEPALLRTRQIIQEKLRIVEEDITYQIKLKEQIRQRDQLREKEQQNSVTPEVQETQVVPSAGFGKPEQIRTPNSENGTNPSLLPEPTGMTNPGFGNGSESQATQQQGQLNQSSSDQSGSSNGSSNGSGGKH
jgi:hypothetical protein